MRFAKYWQQVVIPAKQSHFGVEEVTIWGASNDNDDAALEKARQRADHYKRFFREGFNQLDEYEYFVGFIREEIIDEINNPMGETTAVITRNSYGAHVLNTDHVLIGDIDYPVPGFFSGLLSLIGKKPKDKTYYLALLRSYQEKNRSLKIRVYETFAGLRFIICNKLFKADSEEVRQIFKDLEVDPLYKLLCEKQTCFRARLTPKPWRIGLARPATRFPRKQQRDIQQFKNWLKDYENASASRRSAREIASFGSASTHPDVRSVVEFHDKIACRQEGSLA